MSLYKYYYINYDKLFKTDPIYHQICSSKLISSIGYFSTLSNFMFTLALDFRWSGSAHFQMMNMLCKIASRTIDAELHRFQATPFIAHYVHEKNLFEVQARAISDSFINKTTDEFARTLEFTRSLTSASQFITLAATNAIGHVTPKFLVFYKQIGFELEFKTSLKSKCYCARDLRCQEQSRIYNFNGDISGIEILYEVPGFIVGCYPLDSLLGSSLACFYNKTCVHELFSFVNRNVNRPVLDSNISTRFDHQAIFKTIVSKLFIEDWQMTQSYSSFYNQSMPSYCSYSTSSKNSLLFMITSLIAVYGGLNEALKLVLPHLVNLIAWFISKLKRRQMINRQQQLRYRKILTFSF